MDHASLGSHIDFERLMNLSRVKPAILSSKRVLVVKPHTVDMGFKENIVFLEDLPHEFLKS